jgi:hypothetical protein
MENAAFATDFRRARATPDSRAGLRRSSRKGAAASRLSSGQKKEPGKPGSKQTMK